MKSPRMIKTHLPSHLLPGQIFEKKPKVIYIARNPKDIMVSYYNMHNLDVTLPSYKSWNDFFDKFIRGDGKNIILFFYFFFYIFIDKDWSLLVKPQK